MCIVIFDSDFARRMCKPSLQGFRSPVNLFFSFTSICMAQQCQYNDVHLSHTTYTGVAALNADVICNVVVGNIRLHSDQVGRVVHSTGRAT